jgi:flagellar M-ring protein FliF
VDLLEDILKRIRNQLNEFWQAKPKKQKLKIGISAAVFVASMALLVYFTSRPEMVPLYSQLDMEEAGAITEKLDEYKVKWEIDDSETTILVPKKEVNKLRMQLATEDLPRKGFSLVEALDNTRLGTTDLERRERLRVGQEYAIAQAIETIEGVEYSQVNLYIPGDSVFAVSGSEYQSSAGILIKLQPGASLSQHQIDGIIQFVSKSVKGLTKENISIIDQTGRELSSETDTQQGRLLKQLEIEQNIQGRMQRSIKEFLETAYGKNNVDVRVNLKLDFDSQVTSIVKFEPPIPGEESGLVRSIQELEEHALNAGRGGVPGTDSNLDDIVSYAEVEGGESKYDTISRTVNYELNQIKEEIVKAQGQVKSLTVAVLINSVALAQDLTPADRDNIADIVAAAAGIDSQVVQIQSLPFDTSLATEIAQGFDARQRMEKVKLYTYMGGLGVLIVLGIIGSLLVIRKSRQVKEEAFTSRMEVAVADDVEEIDLNQGQTGARKQVERFIGKKPEVAAQLLKTWLKEE